MGKQTELLETIEEVKEEISFKPSRRDKELKARFWTRVVDDPFANEDTYSTRASAERLVQTKIANWDIPGFKDWFYNKDEHRHKLEYLFGLCLDAAEEILLNSDPKVQGARVQLIRALSELAGKVPHKQAAIANTQQSAISSAIEGMTRAELQLYLENQGVGSLTLTASKGDKVVEKDYDKTLDIGEKL